MRPPKRYHQKAYHQKAYHQKARRRRLNVGRFVVFLLILAAAASGAVLAVMFFTDAGLFRPKAEPAPTSTPAPYVTPAPAASDQPETTADLGPVPAASDTSQPSNFGFSTDIESDGQTVDSYQSPFPVTFPDPSAYTQLKGVTTFRGNNFRDGGSYGAVNVTTESLERAWDIDIGALTKWSGAGYTCQPLIVQWDPDMRQMMNLREDKKTKDTLVEVICPTMDGKIYFLDLDDGSYTRDPIEMGFTVKGTASLDPRGYPLLYVGQGIGMSGDETWDHTYMYVYSLIDGQALYTYGAAQKDAFAYRESWQSYDSSPLVSADADTLVWPGENGVVYAIRLNSEFDRAAGTVSVSPPPHPVKYRYTTPLNADDNAGVPGARWWGVEGAPSVWKNYLYFTDNGGWLQCVDLNTMQLVFAQDLTDDTDCAPLLEQDGDNLYLYTGCEVDKQVPEGGEEGTAWIRKVDAMTGDILWEKPYRSYYVNKIDGGVLASPLLGKGDMEGMVVFTIARYGGREAGAIIAFDKNTGDVVWEQSMRNYSWSSPVAVYTPQGKGYIIQCDSGGNMTLRDGQTGDSIDSVSLGIRTNIEASPAAFNDMVVVGTRGEKIFGVRIG